MQRLADERHKQLLDGIHGIHQRLDRLNGRTSANEIDLATLTERVEHMRPSRQGGIAGAIGGVISGFMAGFLK